MLGPGIAEQNYGGTEVYGIVEAALGAGTIFGAIAGIRWRPLHPMRLGLVMGALWCPMAVMYALGAPLAIVLPAAVVGGFGFSVFDVWWMTALAERIPPDRLSRVSSYDWMVSLGLLPVGYLLAGPARGGDRRRRGARGRLRPGDGRLAAGAAAPRDADARANPQRPGRADHGGAPDGLPGHLRPAPRRSTLTNRESECTLTPA